MTTTAVIVMGVSGCGKSTVGPLLAEKLGWPFEDGDAFHPPANIEKQRAGIPLTDKDRWPWLAIIAARIAEARAAGTGVVVGCSALKRVYRDALRDGHADVRFVHLAGTLDLIAARQGARKGHFMPASLVANQFATLEPPEGEPGVVTVGVEAEPAVLADAAYRALQG